MCGIVGVINKKSSVYSRKEAIELTNSLLHHSQSRGRDSSGIAVVKDKEIIVVKAATSADHFINSKEYQEAVSGDTRHFAAIGHSRMETNGSFAKKENNQPVVKDGIVTIHNGIIVNDSLLWKKHNNLERETEVDTEVFNSIFREGLRREELLSKALRNSLGELKGSYCFGVLFEDQDYLLLCTNTGSLYTVRNHDSSIFFFASEKRFLDKVLGRSLLFENSEELLVSQVQPNTAILVDLNSLDQHYLDLRKEGRELTIKSNGKKSRKVRVVYPNVKAKNLDLRVDNSSSREKLESVITEEYSKASEKINRLTRCTNCLLPETMPFISYDSSGVCNFCHNYLPRETRGEDDLERVISKHRTTDGKPNCIVSFSGGRDSSYSLHYAKEELGLTPLAYSYDWGMLTDLGRRNQARMTGQLGVEHILVSADIQKKREFIRKNVQAWLKNPNIGMVPLFMAGDKQYFYHLNKLRKETGIDLVIYADNVLEKTDFKYGFAGIELSNKMGKAYNIGMYNSISLLQFYFRQYLRNPGYINSSLTDTFTAYMSSYFVDKSYLYIFRYLFWDEKVIEKTLLDNYDWEISPDTKSTWRIGDGTASFYNYIYYIVTGLTENDTFRSNQIREGSITRDMALKRSIEDNRPRIDSILWYCSTIGIDALDAIKRIHDMKRLYE